MRRAARIAAVVATVLLVAGCTSDPLAEDYLDGGSDNYLSGSGIVEIPEAERGDPVEFTGSSEDGSEISRADYDGSVLVVNFWYASCAPCRAEAPDLEELSQEYRDQGASFLGVNVYDGPETSLAFARQFGVTYPSVLDVDDGDVRLAFAGQISPKAVPTTFVLDSEGRIAARLLGQLQEKSILDTIVGDVVGETA